MRLALLVTASPDRDTARQACDFAEAALAAGHTLGRVFFAGQGVAHGQALAVAGREHTSLTARWQALQQAHDLDLVLCVAAALRLGVLDADNACRWEQPAASLAHGFSISGLGQLAEAQLTADRLITFPD